VCSSDLVAASGLINIIKPTEDQLERERQNSAKNADASRPVREEDRRKAQAESEARMEKARKQWLADVEKRAEKIEKEFRGVLTRELEAYAANFTATPIFKVVRIDDFEFSNLTQEAKYDRKNLAWTAKLKVRSTKGQNVDLVANGSLTIDSDLRFVPPGLHATCLKQLLHKGKPLTRNELGDFQIV
jgi:hypothetical protein